MMVPKVVVSVQETAADLGDTQDKPSHEKGHVCAASEGAVQETASAKSLHADLSERHAAAGTSQVSNQRSVASRGKDKMVGPSSKDMQPSNATSEPTHITGPSQEPTKQAKTQSESSMSSRTEACRVPIQGDLAKKPDKGKAIIKDLESSEGDESSGKGTLPKGKAKTMASYNDQPCDSEEDLEVDSRQVHSDQNDEETSSIAFATVRKKKGGSWNIRGLNGLNKQIAVRDWIIRNRLGMVGLLKPRFWLAIEKRLRMVCNMQPWSYIMNAQPDGKSRIMVGWDPTKFHVVCASIDHRWITCNVNSLAASTQFTITFVYGMHSRRIDKSFGTTLRFKALALRRVGFDGRFQRYREGF
ncbi:hypothetical protein OIU84_003417 [Salix udensis]|uniref:Uncharacterized protein n=1 Tax=Salix udensis TaxID=889485 RepID=A0AAD6K001_9ROSI|nr:hypothetical protein OIU84_003417 [Salix udensis]